MSSFVEIPAGQFIFREGDPGNEMYIIEVGSVEITRQVRGAQPLAVLEPGDFFGEMAVLEDQPRFASARAKENSRLLRIDRSAFAELVQQNFEIAVRIMRKLALRLRRTEQSLQHASTELGDIKRRLNAPTAAISVSAEIRAVTAAASSAAATVLMKLRHDSGAEFAVRADQRELLIGRPDPVTGVVPEIDLGALDSQRTLSRRHAKILIEGGMIFLREEVGCANGTQINGVRIKTGVPTPIKIGDELRFGSIDLAVLAI